MLNARLYVVISLKSQRALKGIKYRITVAIYHTHGQVISKSQGRSAVSAAAYRSASKLIEYIVDKETGLTISQVWDYTKKSGVVYSKVYAPENAPTWVNDREKLWNNVIGFEKRKDAQLAREFDVALPVELSVEENIALMEEIIQECYVKHGMIADANLHLDNPKNPHFHVMLTMREIVEKENGEKDFGFKKRDWNTKEFLLNTRQQKAELINKHLAFHGHLSRVSHLSYEDRGIGLVPSIKIGAAHHITNTERQQINHEIAVENARRIALNPELVFDKLSINKPVFTKEDIVIALNEALTMAQNAKEELVALNDNDLSKFVDLKERDFSNAANENITNDNAAMDMSQEFMATYFKVMNSDKLSLVVEEDLRGRKLYCLTKRIELEKEFIGAVEGLNNSYNHRLNVTAEDLEKSSFLQSIKNKITNAEEQKLGLEQEQAVIEILNGSDISALIAPPGAGKTTIMKAAVEQYRRAGKQVLALATSQSAAVILGKETGVEAMNIDLFRKKMSEGNSKEDFKLNLKMDFWKAHDFKKESGFLTKDHVIIVDEASMVELSRSHYIVSSALAVGAKVIKLGDNNQLAAIGAGGAFQKVCNLTKPSVLSTIYRQRDSKHAEATKSLANYDIEGFLNIYEQEGSIKISDNQEIARKQLVSDYVESYLRKVAGLDKDDLIVSGGNEDVIAICAYTNKDVSDLNALVRSELKRAGIIKGKEVAVKVKNGELLLVRGEQVIFGENSKRLGVVNGEIGTVLKVKDLGEGNWSARIKLKKASGELSTINLDSREKYPYQALNHAYALTAYKLQGATVSELFALMSKEGLGYELAMVMATRHRDRLTMYCGKRELENVVYQRLNEDPELSKELNEIVAKPPLWRLGLNLALHKRSNISFAVDYENMGLSKEDRVLKEYIDSRADFARTIREITAWQERREKITGEKPSLSEHESWDKALEYRNIRDEAAGIICGNYPAYGARITQLNLNYQTIRKHAGLAEHYAINRQEQYNLVNHAGYQKLINSLHELTRAQTREAQDQQVIKLFGVIENYKILSEEIAERKIDLENVESLASDKSAKRYMLQDALNRQERFSQKLFPEYLSRIYRDDYKDVVHKWYGLVRDNGLKAACKMVESKPRLLGDLRGIGIGSFVALTSKRTDAIANLHGIGAKFKEYHNSDDEIRALKEALNNPADRLEESRLISEVQNLKKQLPTYREEQILREIDSIVRRDAQEAEKLAKLHDFASSDVIQDEALTILALNSNNKVREDVMKQQQSNLEAKEHNALKSSMLEERQPRQRKTKRLSNNPLYHSLKLAKNDKTETTAKEEAISFAAIKAALTSNDFEQLFRFYANDINQDGKIRKVSNNMQCGSLSMDLKTGLWIRHSSGDKGDIFHFVSNATGNNSKKALELIVERLGFKEQDGKLARDDKALVISEEFANQLNSKASGYEREDQWLRVDVIPENIKFNATKDISYMLKENELGGTYEYRNINGQLLGYTVRLIDKESGKKQVLPVSYCENQDNGKQQWRLKGFTDEAGQKPIYGLEKLANNHFKSELPILIVEGEKTADKAQELLPEYQVISWLGGSKAAGAVNWQALENRDVVIWPDNDQAGFSAAHTIRQRLQDIAKSCMIVDPKAIGVEEKWDLADAKEQDLKNIRAALVSSHHLESLKIVDQKIGALDHIGLNNEQLIILLEKEVIAKLTEEGKNSPKYLSRVQEELQVISKTGYAGDGIA